MSRVTRKEALTVAQALRLFLRSSNLAAPHNYQRMNIAWENASGASKYTLKTFYREGKFYVTLGSSVVRNQLSFQKAALLEKMNSVLEQDELFIGNGSPAIKELILK